MAAEASSSAVFGSIAATCFSHSACRSAPRTWFSAKPPAYLTVLEPTTESTFANQLGLNGTLMLFSAAKSLLSSHRDNIWKSDLPPAEALGLVRKMLLTDSDTLVGEDQAGRHDPGGVPHPREAGRQQRTARRQ